LLAARQKRAVEDLQKNQTPARQEFIDAVRTHTQGLSKKDAAAFMSYAMGRRAQWYEENEGKGPTRADIKTILEDATREVVIEGRIFDSTKPTYKVRPGEKEKPSPDETPPSPTGAAPKKSRNDRAAELIREGKTDAQIKATLKSEGY
jgi:hypothetical protein